MERDKQRDRIRDTVRVRNRTKVRNGLVLRKGRIKKGLEAWRGSSEMGQESGLTATKMRHVSEISDFESHGEFFPQPHHSIKCPALWRN